jgi:hypothetical protein
MGMERVVQFAGPPPTWAAIQKELAAAGLPVTVRMIDGLPAFPDEVPPDDWSEVRISTPSGMMTLRKQSDGIAVAVWGNADDKLQAELERVVEACAKVERN